jgi:hypothetical protein
MTDVIVVKLSEQGGVRQGLRLTGFDRLNEKEKGELGAVKGVVGLKSP